MRTSDICDTAAIGRMEPPRWNGGFGMARKAERDAAAQKASDNIAAAKRCHGPAEQD
jgi:hypothetical protein